MVGTEVKDVMQDGCVTVGPEIRLIQSELTLL